MKELTAEQDLVMKEWEAEQVKHVEEVQAWWDEQCEIPLGMNRDDLPF